MLLGEGSASGRDHDSPQAGRRGHSRATTVPAGLPAVAEGGACREREPWLRSFAMSSRSHASRRDRDRRRAGATVAHRAVPPLGGPAAEEAPLLRHGEHDLPARRTNVRARPPAPACEGAAGQGTHVVAEARSAPPPDDPGSARARRTGSGLSLGVVRLSLAGRRGRDLGASDGHDRDHPPPRGVPTRATGRPPRGEPGTRSPQLLPRRTSRRARRSGAPSDRLPRRSTRRSRGDEGDLGARVHGTRVGRTARLDPRRPVPPPTSWWSTAS